MDHASRCLQGDRPGWTVTVSNAREEQADQPPVNHAFTRESDDQTLVAAALDGAPEAFDILVERHRRIVYHVCYRYTGSHEDASDRAQDTFVRAYRSLRTYRGQSAFSTWLYRIAVNACLNHAGTSRPDTEPLVEARPIAADMPGADEELMRQQQAEQLRRAIAKLPDRQRMTVILRVYHELTHEQIAASLGSSVGTVKANFFHAVRNLRAYLGAGQS